MKLRIEGGGVGLRNNAVNQNFNAIKIYWWCWLITTSADGKARLYKLV